MPTTIDVRARETLQITPEARKCLRNTYLLLGLTLLPTVLGAAVGVAYPIFQYLGAIGSLVAFMVVLFGLQSVIVKNRDSVAGINYLLLFTAFMGYFMGPLLGAALSFSNGVDMIAVAFVGTAATFFLLAGYATVTTRNFASPGVFKTLFIGMWMAFGLGIVNYLFLGIPMLGLAISAVFIPIASAFIVFTINNIVRGGETNYIMATMTVYIMLLNIFQSLLHILMAFTGNRE